MSLLAQKEERKKRLQALKNKVEQGNAKRPAEVSFKSYVPHSETLQKYIAEPVEAGPLAIDVNTVEKTAEAIRQQTFEQESKRNPELDLSNLAPKKPNWDLKRDLEAKMEKLDRLTLIAVSDFIRIFCF